MKFQVSELTLQHVEEIYNLHRMVVAGLQNPQTFRVSDLEFYSRHVGSQGRSFGVTDNGRLIAYSIIRFPGAMADNLGLDLNLGITELDQVAHLEECAVHPLFRGQGLQLLLTKIRMKYAEQHGSRHIAVTVSPAGHTSLRNQLRMGLSVRALVKKYENMTRFILHKDLSSNKDYNEELCLMNKRESICLEDLSTLRARLKAGWVGHAMSVNGAKPSLMLTQPITARIVGETVAGATAEVR